MDVLQQKKLLVERIFPHLIDAPDDVVQRFLQKSVSDLETILEDAITKKARDRGERTSQPARRRHACRVRLGRRMDACLPRSDKWQAFGDRSK